MAHLRILDYKESNRIGPMWCSAGSHGAFDEAAVVRVGVIGFGTLIVPRQVFSRVNGCSKRCIGSYRTSVRSFHTEIIGFIFSRVCRFSKGEKRASEL